MVMISSFFLINKVNALNVNYNGVNYNDEWVYNKLLEYGYDLRDYEYVTFNAYLTGSYYIRLDAWNGDFPVVTSSSGNSNKSLIFNINKKDKWVHFEYYMNSGNVIKSDQNSSSSTSSTGYLTYVNTSTYPRGTVSGVNDIVYNGKTYTFDEFDWSFLPPTSYEFNEDIDVTDISKIKINFELPEDTRNLGLELDFSIKGLTENAGTIGAPYVSLTSKDENNYDQVDIIDFDYGVSERANLISNMCDIVDCWDTFDSTKYSATFETCIDNLEKIDSVDINKPRLIKEELSNWYTDEYVDKLYDSALILVNKTYILNTSYSNKLYMSLLPDSTTYKYSLEIDTINYQGLLNLNFISNLNYSIEYEYVVDNVDYYVTIDMSKYSALVLIPKVYYGDTNTSASFLSDMYLNGTYDIELWEDLESKNVLERYNNYNNSVFSHYFDYHYKSSILYFINKNIGVDGSYIKFDSRYYNYALKNNLTEEVIITNPNTGEDMTIPDISDLYDYGSSKDGRFTFNSFLKPIKFVFESITNFYNNYCPEIVQYFFYIIFTFFVLLVLIKIFL